MNMQARVVACLDAQGKSTRAQLAAGTGLTDRQVGHALTKLCLRGLVLKRGGGKVYHWISARRVYVDMRGKSPGTLANLERLNARSWGSKRVRNLKHIKPPVPQPGTELERAFGWGV
jgi:hypothetical protein